MDQKVNASGLSCVSNIVLGCWDSYKIICDLMSQARKKNVARPGLEPRVSRLPCEH